MVNDQDFMLAWFRLHRIGAIRYAGKFRFPDDIRTNPMLAWAMRQDRTFRIKEGQ
jgi:hypothetical protein